MNNNMMRNIFIYTVIALVLLALFNQFQSAGSRANVAELKYSTFKEEVAAGNVRDVVIRQNSISGTYVGSEGTFTVSKGDGIDPGLVSLMEAQGVV